MAADAMSLQDRKNISFKLNLIRRKETACQAAANNNSEEEMPGMHGMESDFGSRGRASADVFNVWRAFDDSLIHNHQPHGILRKSLNRPPLFGRREETTGRIFPVQVWRSADVSRPL
jgi:hypothetical protein